MPSSICTDIIPKQRMYVLRLFFYRKKFFMCVMRMYVYDSNIQQLSMYIGRQGTNSESGFCAQTRFGGKQSMYICIEWTVNGFLVNLYLFVLIDIYPLYCLKGFTCIDQIKKGKYRPGHIDGPRCTILNYGLFQYLKPV